MALSALTLGALIGVLPLAYALRLLTFTYGARGLDPSWRLRAAIRGGLWIAGALAFEGLVRAPLLAKTSGALGTAGAGVAAAVAGALLVGLPLALRGKASDTMGRAGALAHETALQALWTIVLVVSGGWVTTGLLHGIASALRTVLIGDATGPHETLFFWVSSDRRLRWALLAAPAAAALGWSLLPVAAR